MLRKLMILVCLASATNAVAQHTAAPATKITEKQDDAKIDYKVIGSPMPPLKVLLYSDTTAKKDTGAGKTAQKPMKKKHKKAVMNESSLYLTGDDLDNGANLFVMMFNPTCSHCEDETAMLEKNISLFDKTQLILVANPGMRTYLPDFVNRLHVDKYPSIHIGIDSSGYINNVYLFSSLPQINIYDRYRKLLKIYNGEVAVDSLKKYIQ